MLQAETEDWPLPTLLDSWTFRRPLSYPPPLQTLWQRNSETRYLWWPFTLYMYLYYHTHSLRACICITKSFTALGINTCTLYYKIIHRSHYAYTCITKSFTALGINTLYYKIIHSSRHIHCITKSFTGPIMHIYTCIKKIIHSCKPIHVYEICTYIDIFVQISLFL